MFPGYKRFWTTVIVIIFRFPQPARRNRNLHIMLFLCFQQFRFEVLSSFPCNAQTIEQALVTAATFEVCVLAMSSRWYA